MRRNACFRQARSICSLTIRRLTPLEAHSYQFTSNCTKTGRPKSFRSKFLQTVRISIIPRHLAVLCFHTLTHSFARLGCLTPVFSTTAALFADNTLGGQRG